MPSAPLLGVGEGLLAAALGMGLVQALRLEGGVHSRGSGCIRHEVGQGLNVASGLTALLRGREIGAG